MFTPFGCHSLHYIIMLDVCKINALMMFHLNDFLLNRIMVNCTRFSTRLFSKTSAQITKLLIHHQIYFPDLRVNYIPISKGCKNTFKEKENLTKIIYIKRKHKKNLRR